MYILEGAGGVTVLLPILIQNISYWLFSPKQKKNYYLSIT